MKIIRFVRSDMEFEQNAEFVTLSKHYAHEHKFTKMPIEDKFFAHTQFGEVEINKETYFSIGQILTIGGKDFIVANESKTPDYIFKGYASQEELDKAIKEIEDEKAKQIAENQKLLLKGSNSRPKKRSILRSILR